MSHHEIPCTMCGTMFDPIDSDDYCSVACMKAGIRKGVAEDVIAELVHRTEILDHYRAHPDGHTDFVFVEESVSARLEKALHVADEALEEQSFTATCGLVFDWLKTHQGVTAPPWYRRAIGDGRPR
jgi:hypothetical protein